KRRILNGSKKMNSKLSKWNARTFQFTLEYKLKWLNLPVKYVDPKNSSKACPVCSGSMASYLGRLMKCEKCGFVMDRDIVAVLNLQMRGEGFPQRAPNEIIQGEGLYMSIKDYVAQNPKRPLIESWWEERLSFRQQHP
ncbi:MAG: transposase, partial [Candidatus Bathyarchaeia archaeon]